MSYVIPIAITLIIMVVILFKVKKQNNKIIKNDINKSLNKKNKSLLKSVKAINNGEKDYVLFIYTTKIAWYRIDHMYIIFNKIVKKVCNNNLNFIWYRNNLKGKPDGINYFCFFIPEKYKKIFKKRDVWNKINNILEAYDDELNDKISTTKIKIKNTRPGDIINRFNKSDFTIHDYFLNEFEI